MPKSYFFVMAANRLVLVEAYVQKVRARIPRRLYVRDEGYHCWQEGLMVLCLRERMKKQ